MEKLTIALQVSLEELIKGTFVIEFLQHPGVMVVRYTGIFWIPHDVNHLQFFTSSFTHFQSTKYNWRLCHENKAGQEHLGFPVGNTLRQQRVRKM